MTNSRPLTLNSELPSSSTEHFIVCELIVLVFVLDKFNWTSRYWTETWLQIIATLKLLTTKQTFFWVCELCLKSLHNIIVMSVCSVHCTISYFLFSRADQVTLAFTSNVMNLRQDCLWRELSLLLMSDSKKQLFVLRKLNASHKTRVTYIKLWILDDRLM